MRRAGEAARLALGQIVPTLPMMTPFVDRRYSRVRNLSFRSGPNFCASKIRKYVNELPPYAFGDNLPSFHVFLLKKIFWLGKQSSQKIKQTKKEIRDA